MQATISQLSAALPCGAHTFVFFLDYFCDPTMFVLDSRKNALRSRINGFHERLFFAAAGRFIAEGDSDCFRGGSRVSAGTELDLTRRERLPNAIAPRSGESSG